MSGEAVLDASAVLVLLQREPGWERVAGLLPGARISSVNLAEVATKLAEAGLPPEAARAAVAALTLTVVPFDEGMAWATGALRSRTRAAGLSLGDRACLALALEARAPAVTADRAWAGLTDAEVLPVRG